MRAAAAGDFVVAFYNPVSQRRRELLGRARDILLEHRPADTPVVLARNLGRPDETTAADRAGRARRRPCATCSPLVLVGSSAHAARAAPARRGLGLHPARLPRRMTVHFIGAGPGAPDLITVRGLRLIQRCPVCLYAGSLVPAEVVAEAPAGARVVDTASMHLDEIMAEIEAAHTPGPGRRPGPFRRPLALRRHRRADPPPRRARHRLDDHARRAGLRRRRGGPRRRADPARHRPVGRGDPHRRARLGHARRREPRRLRRHRRHARASTSRSTTWRRSCAS